MKDCKIVINSYVEFEETQIILFGMGCYWASTGTQIKDIGEYPSDQVILVQEKQMTLTDKTNYINVPIRDLEWLKRQCKSEEVKPEKFESVENKTMTVKIKCKDSTTPVYYKNVVSHFTEGNTLALLFEDGKVRNIPFMHIWYYQTKQPREKTMVPSEIN